MKTEAKTFDEWKEDGRFSDKELRQALKESLHSPEAEAEIGTDDGTRCVLRISEGTEV